MPIIIMATFRDGNVRTCGPDCYDAQTLTCHCICNGRNHTIGLDRAIARNLKSKDEITAEIMLRFPTAAFVSITTKLRHDCTGQLELFDQDSTTPQDNQPP